MKTNTEKLTCADKVQSAFESRIHAIRTMLDPALYDVELGDDGSLDTVIYCGDEVFRYTDAASWAYRDEQTGEFDMDYFLDSEFENIRQTMQEVFCDYGLSFDYVDPNTFENQPEGYLRYQISYGGPSEEFRFYVSRKHDFERLDRDFSYVLHRAEFWYLDWFDGARVNCTDNKTAQMLYEWFDDCEMVTNAITGAA